MATLKDFPLITRAFNTIELDNGGTHARKLRLETEIPEEWVIPFHVTEDTFRKIGEVKLKETLAWKLLPDQSCYLEDTPAWEAITLPVNDDHKIIMNAMGIHPTDQWMLNRILYEFFDGELSCVFTEIRRH